MLVPLTLIHGNAPQLALSRHTSSTNTRTTGGINDNLTLSDLLFRALNLIFAPRTSGSAMGVTMTDKQSKYSLFNTSIQTGTGTNTSGTSQRAAAFIKRLLSASLHSSSSSTVLRTLDFAKTLVAQYPKLEAMLSTEDRIYNGVYRPEVDDPQLCNPFETSFWEVHVLHARHWDPRVREAAGGLLNYRASS